ncbi:MAG: MATE family efflux transporter [Clostridia bacterium]|nr:MATE family efflux transporter [Clostridia bacterium]
MRNIDATTGRITPNLLKLAWPVAISNLANVFYNIADTFFVGQLENSAQAISAVTVSFNVVFLLVAFAIGISTATTTLISQYYGAKDHDNLEKTVHTSLVVICSLAFVVTITGIFTKSWIFALLQTEPEVIPLAEEYFTIIMVGMFFMFTYFVLSSMLRGVGDTKTPMIAGVVSNIINIVLDPFLIYGWLFFPELGVAGAAYATVFSRFVLSVYLYYRVIQKDCPLGVKLSHFKIDFAIVREIFRIGIPSSLSEMSVAFGSMLILGRVNVFGTIATAAHGIGTRFDSLLYLPMAALGQASATMVGQNLGAKNRDRAYRTGIAAMKFIFLSTLGITIVFILFAKPLLSLFTNSIEVVDLGSFYFYYHFSFFCFLGLRVAMLFAFYGAGDSRSAFITTIIALFVLRVPLSYLFSYTGLGIKGIWLGMGLSYLITSAFMIVIFTKKKWMEKAVTLRNEIPAAQ